MLIRFKNWIKNQWGKTRKWFKALFFVPVAMAAGLASQTPTAPVTIDRLTIQAKYQDATIFNAKYTNDGSSFKKVDIKNAELDKYKKEPKDKIEVVLGDKNSQEFKPDIEMKRWDEVSFKLKPRGLEAVKATDKSLDFANEKARFNTPKMDFEMYDIVEGEGGYKYIWYLNEKPASSTIEFDIETSGLDFFYQPPLTQEYQNGYSEKFQKEIVVTETQVKDLDGNVLVERPENVVGSYAVYHSTKGIMNDINGKDYKTGKAFHIYRPHIIDANGVATWGILKIENGIYSVEIPQEFLDKAVYPIKSNDTFGYTTQGTAGNSNFEAIVVGSVFSCPEAGTVTQIDATISSGPEQHAGLVGIYNTSYNLITNGGSSQVSPLRADKGWQTFTFSTNPTVSATDYVLIIHGNAVGFSTAQVFYDAGSANQGLTDANAYTGSAISSFASPTLNNNKYSIYATYTADGGASSTPSSYYIIDID